MKKVLYSLIGAALLVACSSENKQAQNVKWKTFQNDAFQMEYPETWKLENENDVVTFLAPFDDENEYLQENANVTITDFSGTEITLDDFGNEVAQDITQKVPGAKNIQSKRVKINGMDCQEITYKMKQEIYDTQITQYVFLQDEMCYMITLTQEEKRINDYKSFFDKIVQSFKLA
ncbi:MAG: hypothetical protein IT221_03270 [Fluviicola sp.]|nr:hypothetical protein [Fluviicola sp.]